MSLSRHKQSSSFSMVSKVVGFIFLVVAVSAASLPVLGQGSQGTINGGVFDSTGGSIANAKVTVTDVARGTTRNLTADEAGKYVAPSLTTGTYSVRAEAAGFGTVQRENILVEVGSNIRVDLTLAP